MIKNICIIGAGNIGSRHLQALKTLKPPLSIEVVDPSEESLKVARQRYDQIPAKPKHQIAFFRDLSSVSRTIDLCIIATSSNIRAQVIEKLLKRSQIKYLILEKILFSKKADYPRIEKLLTQKGVKTWINFSMRTMPFYRDLKKKITGPLMMIVSGSEFGLVTNAIHFVDYLNFLTGCDDFKVSTELLDPKIIDSKRPGFRELNGTLNIYLKDGSQGTFISYAAGDTPYSIELISPSFRAISREPERLAYLSSAKNQWRWQQKSTNIPFTSQMTTRLVNQILRTGTCNLTTYSQAAKLHLQLLEGLLKFLNQHSNHKFNFYPFT